MRGEQEEPQRTTGIVAARRLVPLPRRRAVFARGQADVAGIP